MSTRSIRGVRIVRFGVFELDVRAGELRRENQKVHLQEQPFRILTMLLEHPGDVVLREEICKRLWPNGTVVEVSHGINAAVLRLREALGDSAENPRFVETVARRGYRFVAPAEVECRRSPSSGQVPASSAPNTEDLMIGQAISHFRLEERLGRGGMGVVYRAQDLTLTRPVALKFLAPELAGDPAAVGRFQREARTASALNHPNVCTVYAVEECAGQPVIVMELVEGRTLESLLAEGPVPVDRALPLAIQMAAALDAAHRKGIVHRDLKPGNVMVTQFGVKVLDFGLAKQVSATPPAAGVTQTGSILGTPNYMAPEMFQGKEADARSDLYSFGVVLFEMLAGCRAEADPFRKLPPAAADLEPLVRRALQAKPEDRWQTAGDLKAALECIAASRVSHQPAPPVPIKRQTATRWWIAAVAAAAVIVAIPFSWNWYTDRAAQPAVRIAFAPPTTTPPPPTAPRTEKQPAPAKSIVLGEMRPAVSGRLNLSPNGRLLAYSVAGEVYVRSVDGQDTHLAASTTGMAGTPFWSPDSQSIAFTNGGHLYTVAAQGATAKPIGDINTNLAGAWGPDGTILIGEVRGGLLAIPASGGTARMLTKPDEARGESRHLLPQFLPGGRNFLYTAGSENGGGMLYAGSLDSDLRKEIMPIDSGATFVPRRGTKGYLVFLRAGNLMAQPFDAAALRTEGEAVRVAGPVNTSGPAAASKIAIPDATVAASRLVYRTGGAPRMQILPAAVSGRGAVLMQRDVVVLENWMAALQH